MTIHLSDLPPALRAKLADQLPKRSPAPRRAMNGDEAAYAARLTVLQSAGEVAWWGFEAVKLVLAREPETVIYTPDFVVVTPAGAIEVHEVKGHEREAGILRWKLAAERFPWITFLMLRRDGERWTVTREANGATADASEQAPTTRKASREQRRGSVAGEGGAA